MTTYITNLEAATELEAVNAMLSAIGEQPVTTLATAQPDVAMALNTLRNHARQVQSEGWRFNTEFGFQLSPDDTLDWEDNDGVTTTLNIFLIPANLAKFSLTATAEQATLDVIIRPSRVYEVTAAPALVFYDRSLNRDGFDSTIFDYLYINPVWYYDFPHLPQEARQLIFVRSARQFVQEKLGSDALASFKTLDERIAYRDLKEAHGLEDKYNMNTKLTPKFGYRPIITGTPIDIRKSPNVVP
jgi:hypothetical protein